MSKITKPIKSVDINHSVDAIKKVGYVIKDIGKNAMVTTPPPTKPKETKTSK